MPTPRPKVWVLREAAIILVLLLPLLTAEPVVVCSESHLVVDGPYSQTTSFTYKYGNGTVIGRDVNIYSDGHLILGTTYYFDVAGGRIMDEFTVSFGAGTLFMSREYYTSNSSVGDRLRVVSVLETTTFNITLLGLEYDSDRAGAVEVRVGMIWYWQEGISRRFYRREVLDGHFVQKLLARMKTVVP